MTLSSHIAVRGNLRNLSYSDSLISVLDIENNKFALPPWKQLLQYRVVVCSCSDAGILLGAQCTNRSLMAMEREVATGFRPHRRSRAISQPHWTHLLIDEVCVLAPLSPLTPILTLQRRHKDRSQSSLFQFQSLPSPRTRIRKKLSYLNSRCAVIYINVSSFTIFPKG